MARFVSVQTQPPSAESAEEPKGQTVWGAEVLPFGASEYMGMGNMGHTGSLLAMDHQVLQASLRMIKHSYFSSTRGFWYLGGVMKIWRDRNQLWGSQSNSCPRFWVGEPTQQMKNQPRFVLRSLDLGEIWGAEPLNHGAFGDSEFVAVILRGIPEI